MFQVCATWEGKKKLVATEKLIPRSSAYVLIQNNSKILLAKMKTNNKLWFPGGVIEAGETPEQAAIREAKEEAGLTVSNLKFLCQVQSYFYFDPLDKAWQQDSHFFVTEAYSGEIAIDQNPDAGDVSGEVTWYSKDELNENNMQDYGIEVVRMVFGN